MKHFCNKKQNHGFGLMEALLVLAAGVAFTAGGYYLYTSGQSQANVQQQVSFVTHLDNKVQNSYSSLSTSKIKNIDTSTLIQKNIVSQNQIHNGQINAYIGNNVTHVQGTTYNNRAYVLYSVSGINKQQCINYSKLASNNFDVVGLSHGGYASSLSSVNILQNQNNNKKLNPTNLVSSCKSGTNNTVTVANSYGTVNNQPVALNVGSSGTSGTSSSSSGSSSTSTASTSISTSSPTTSTTSSPTTSTSTTTTSTSSSTSSTSTSISPKTSTSSSKTSTSKTSSTSTSTSGTTSTKITFSMLTKNQKQKLLNSLPTIRNIPLGTIQTGAYIYAIKRKNHTRKIYHRGLLQAYNVSAFNKSISKLNWKRIFPEIKKVACMNYRNVSGWNQIQYIYATSAHPNKVSTKNKCTKNSSPTILKNTILY